MEVRLILKLINESKYSWLRLDMPHVSIGVKDVEEWKLDLSKALPQKGIEFEEGKITKLMQKIIRLFIEKGG
ncbi:hypothetical protein [Sulfuracidifex metallicus]|uniref:hypothetical protein n=1 Tax=Sulfuracidifex metallicus TaxID=47303 RepID=UPI001588150D|nr:hypothetical protein [Sulfuracidifex metallicus]